MEPRAVAVTFKAILYLVALLGSLACTVFLFREYFFNRVRLLLWSALCFVGLTVNNTLLYLNLMLQPEADLRITRHLASLFGVMFLLYGFIWETDSQ
jgi:hypothetical protein